MIPEEKCKYCTFGDQLRNSGLSAMSSKTVFLFNFNPLALWHMTCFSYLQVAGALPAKRPGSRYEADERSA